MTNPFTRAVLGSMYCDDSIAELFSAPSFARHMLATEASWTRGLQSVGAITAGDAEKALQAIKACHQSNFTAGSAQDGVPVPALVKALRAGLDAGPAKAIHTGLTSQDVIDTAMVLTLLQVHQVLDARLHDITGTIAALITRFGDIPLVARTRMQVALPATVAHRLGSWQRTLEGQLARSAALRAELGKVQVGGAIGLRDAPDGKAEHVASLVAGDLGLSLGPVWHTDRSAFVSFGHWMTLVSGALGKIGQDVALMAQQGVEEITLRGGGGSSAMPHKNNPVAAEAMVALARFVAVQQGGLAQAMVHEQERSGAAWALEWLTLPVMAEATGAALVHCRALLDQIDTLGTPR